MFLCGEILVNWLFIYMIVSASDRVEAVEKKKKERKEVVCEQA